MQEANQYAGIIAGILGSLAILLPFGWSMFKNLVNRIVIGVVDTKMEPVNKTINNLNNSMAVLTNQIQNHEKRVVNEHPTIVHVDEKFSEINRRFDQTDETFVRLFTKLDEVKDRQIQELLAENARLRSK